MEIEKECNNCNKKTGFYNKLEKMNKKNNKSQMQNSKKKKKKKAFEKIK